MSELDEIKAELAALKQQLASTPRPQNDQFPEELKDKYRKLLEEKPSNETV